MNESDYSRLIRDYRARLEPSSLLLASIAGTAVLAGMLLIATSNYESLLHDEQGPAALSSRVGPHLNTSSSVLQMKNNKGGQGAEEGRDGFRNALAPPTLTKRLLDANVWKGYTLSVMKKRAWIGELIEREFGKRTKDENVILAALVNAYHESTWNEAAASAGCYGIFQIKNPFDGRKHPIERLKTAEYNVSVMARSYRITKMIEWRRANPKADAGECAYYFAAKVERCAVSHRGQRRATAITWRKNLDALR